MRRLLFILPVLFCFAPSLHAQSANTDKYLAKWQLADSFLKKSWPATAKNVAMEVYKDAHGRDKELYQLKASLYLIKAKWQSGRLNDTTFISIAKQELKHSSFPIRNIWHSLLADFYHSVYNNNRYQLYNSNKVWDSRDSLPQDMRDWTRAQFYSVISAHYQSSLDNEKKLRQLPSAKYAPVILKGNQPARLRPDLYDLLAYRALDFYTNFFYSYGEPHYLLNNDTMAFLPAAGFCRLSLPAQDTIPQEYDALRLYQKLISKHMNDKEPDALLDADLARLKYVYDKSVHNNKTELYRSALQQIADKYPEQPLGGLAHYLSLRIQYGYSLDGDYHGHKYAGDLKHLEQQLTRLIQQFPGSEVAYKAGICLENLRLHDLSVQCMSYIPSFQTAKFLLKYRNTPTVWFRVICIDSMRSKELSNDTLLWAAPAVLSWATSLPATDDYKQHSTEVILPALPPGAYHLLCSDSAGIRYSANKFPKASFQVTDIALILQNEPGNKFGGYVVHRQTGQPLAAATVTTTMGDTSIVHCTNREGYFTADIDTESNTEVDVAWNGSYYHEQTNYDCSEDKKPDGKKDTTLFLFTDRSIYRPGQTVYYKGILMHKQRTNADWGIVPGAPVAVSIAPHQEDDSLLPGETFRTNDFGSFSGSFVIPANAPTGKWTIANRYGDLRFSVEEYKRPRFEVFLDTLGTDYRFYDSVTTLVRAVTFSGIPISNASVFYKVSAQSTSGKVYPGRYYENDNKIIDADTGTTDEAGRFPVTFRALPDTAAGVSAVTYKIEAEVVDITGESRHQECYYSIGFHTRIASVYPDPVDNRQQGVYVFSSDLQRNFKPLKIKLSIALLQQPPAFYCSRLWETPDQYIISPDTFRKYFPDDVYQSENDYKAWQISGITGDTTLTNADNTILLSHRFFPENGWYRVLLTTMDSTAVIYRDTCHLSVADSRLPGKIMNPMNFFSDQVTGRNKDSLKLTAFTAINNAYILLHDISNRKTMTHALPTGTTHSASYQRPITDDDNKGVWLGACLIYNNHFFKSEHRRTFYRSNYLDMEVSTFRNKLYPGEQATWTFKVKGKPKEKMHAEVMATLFDASLNLLQPHDWWDYLNKEHWSALKELYGRYYSQTDFQWQYRNEHFFNSYYSQRVIYETRYPKIYDELLSIKNIRRWGAMHSSVIDDNSSLPPLVDFRKPGGTSIQTVSYSKMTVLEEIQAQRDSMIIPDLYATGIRFNKERPAYRKKLGETAFFLPHLRTDTAGTVKITFTIPESLTRWTFMAIAHTKDMRLGFLKDSVITQKPLMVQPDLPRFVYEGDDFILTTKIANLSSDAQLNGKTFIELSDAGTGVVLNDQFLRSQAVVPFSIARGKITTASWKVHIPPGYSKPVAVRIAASAGRFTDGEEHILPVLSARIPVTESWSVSMNGDGHKQYRFNKLLHSDTNSTLSQRQLIIEYTANPLWTAIKSLPYLIEYPYECAEQTFNRYYANSLAIRMQDQFPEIRQVLARYNNGAGSDLQHNNALKMIAASEMPWIADGLSEAQQRKNIARLLDTATLSDGQDRAIAKLQQMMLPEQAFPWFKGMKANRYITQYIATGLQKLESIGVRDIVAQEMNRSLQKYLANQLRSDYEELLRLKADTSTQHIGPLQVQMLYNSSFDHGYSIDLQNKPAFNYFKAQAKKFWPEFNAYLKAMTAISLFRLGDTVVVPDIIRSLRETAIEEPEAGITWKNDRQDGLWHTATIDAQCLLIECFNEVARDTAMTNDLKKWLISQKQAQAWPTTRSTADACYALYSSGSKWSAINPEVTFRLGDTTITPDSASIVDSYTRSVIDGPLVKASMGNMSLNVKSAVPNTMPGYGAVYWQYSEQIDKLSPAATGVSIHKQLFRENSTKGIRTLEDISPATTLAVGDKIMIRIVIKADKDMEYVQLKDMRAACFEPVNVLSDYRWGKNVSYYESTRDASTSFFMDALKKGVYAFEYPVYVTWQGTFTGGITSIQSMYAPELAAHSSGGKIIVK